ncbi:hypothetical protein MRX96_023374 [Rhipicephalus microplus]
MQLNETTNAHGHGAFFSGHRTDKSAVECDEDCVTISGDTRAGTSVFAWTARSSNMDSDEVSFARKRPAEAEKASRLRYQGGRKRHLY